MDDKPAVIDQITPHQKHAWELNEKLIHALQDQTRLFLTIGKMLKEIRDNHLYQYMGDGGYDTFTHYLNGMGVRKPATLYLYIQAYEFYIEKLQMTKEEVLSIPLNRLQLLLPRLKDKPVEEARTILQETGGLTNQDFDTETKERNLVSPKPYLYRDKQTGLFVFEYKPSQMKVIRNVITGEEIVFAEE